jgi:hypothetical protein
VIGSALAVAFQALKNILLSAFYVKAHLFNWILLNAHQELL